MKPQRESTMDTTRRRRCSVLIERFGKTGGVTRVLVDTPPDIREQLLDVRVDSIDAVDLIVQLKPMIGSNLRPEAFKSVRTVGDVVDVVHSMMHATA